MQKVISMLLALVMVLSLIACGSKVPAKVGTYSLPGMKCGGKTMSKDGPDASF